MRSISPIFACVLLLLAGSCAQRLTAERLQAVEPGWSPRFVLEELGEPAIRFTATAEEGSRLVFVYEVDSATGTRSLQPLERSEGERVLRGDEPRREAEASSTRRTILVFDGERLVQHGPVDGLDLFVPPLDPVLRDSIREGLADWRHHQRVQERRAEVERERPRRWKRR